MLTVRKKYFNFCERTSLSLSLSKENFLERLLVLETQKDRFERKQE